MKGESHMEKEDKFEDEFVRMVEANLRLIRMHKDCVENVHFIGNVKILEERLQHYCNQCGIFLKVIDVLEEENQRTNLSNLFDELNYNEEKKNYCMLYLKNYTKTRPTNVRYRFSCIYKNQWAPNEIGIITKENLQFLGTVLLSSEDDVFPLDDSEKSCFWHVKI